MFLPRGLIFYLLLLAACQDSSPKESGSAMTPPLPTPLPDTVLAAQQAGRNYVLDTLAIVSNQRLDTLLRMAEQRTLVSHTSAQALPPVVAAFFHARERERPFVIADTGAPFSAGDAIVDPDLPRRQLVYLGVSPDLVLLSYYSGGVGLSQHVVIFRLQGHTIQDLWSGYVGNDPKTKAELLQQVRKSHEELYRRHLNNSGGLLF
jgi:hypothetical protein